MAKYRLLNRGDVLPASFLSALQEYSGTGVLGLHLSLSNATTVQVVAGANSAVVGLAIDGLWRYISSTINASVSGGAGSYDIFAVTGANSFSNSPQPDTDNTLYPFALQVLATGVTPTITGTVTNFRKIGELQWDGAKVTQFRQLEGQSRATDMTTATAMTKDVVAGRFVSAAAQAASIATFEDEDGDVLANVDASGNVNTTGQFQVSGTQIALANLSNGTTGTGTTVVLSIAPALTGAPTAPTAAVDTNTTQLATTAYVIGQGYLKSAGAATIYAPLASPTFTGTPAAPTAAVDTNTTQLATTAFVLAQAAAATPLIDGGAAVGTSTRYARADHVHPTDTTRSAVASPTFTGTPAAPTASVDTNTTQIATTAYVIGQASASGDGTPAMDGTAARGTGTHFARNDHVHPTDTSLAPLASPTLTGTPAAPTAAVDTNTTQIATTAYVVAQAASANPVMNGAVAVGTSKRYARADHVHATDTSLAPLASPTLTGTPAAPTAAVDTNTTQIATTAYVIGQGYLKSATAASTYAPIASPTFTGTATIPTASVTTFSGTPTFSGAATALTAAGGTNTTQIATTAFVATSFAPLASPTFTGTVTAAAITASGLITAQGGVTTQTGTTITLGDSTIISIGTTGGTKFGSGTTQKMGWWNATPVVRAATAYTSNAAVTSVGVLGLTSSSNLNDVIRNLSTLIADLRTYGLIGA